MTVYMVTNKIYIYYQLMSLIQYMSTDINPSFQLINALTHLITLKGTYQIDLNFVSESEFSI